MHPQEKNYNKLTNKCTHVYVYIQTYIYIDIYIYLHIHPDICTNIYIYIINIYDQVPEDALSIQQQMPIQDGHLPPAKDSTPDTQPYIQNIN